MHLGRNQLDRLHGPIVDRGGGLFVGVPRRISRAAVFVLGVWAAMTAADFWFAAKYARNCPWSDEWTIVPQVCGQPLRLGWIFGQHNEHRLPVPRLVLVALYRATGMNFAAGAFLNVLALSLAALLLIAAARARRGVLRWTDAIFPAALLSWLHWENMLSGWQCQYTLALALASAYLLLLSSPTLIGKRRLLACAPVLLLLAGCGSNGLILSATLSFAMLGAPTSPKNRWLACCVWTVAVMTTAALWPSGTENDVRPHTLPSLVKNGAQMLGMAMGPAYCPVRVPEGFHSPLVMPDTRLFGPLLFLWPFWCVVGLAFCFMCAWTVLRRRADWSATTFWLGGLATLAALSLHRLASWDTTRYTLALCPLPLGMYLILDRRPRISADLALIVVVGAVISFPIGERWAMVRASETDSFLRLVREHKDAKDVKRAGVYLQLGNSEGALPTLIGMLRQAGHPSFVP